MKKKKGGGEGGPGIGWEQRRKS